MTRYTFETMSGETIEVNTAKEKRRELLRQIRRRRAAAYARMVARARKDKDATVR